MISPLCARVYTAVYLILTGIFCCMASCEIKKQCLPPAQVPQIPCEIYPGPECPECPGPIEPTPFPGEEQ